MLLSSKNPVSIVIHVKKIMPHWKKFNGTKIMHKRTNIVMKITPAPVGFPFATSAFIVNSRPRSCGRNLYIFGINLKERKKPL